MNALVHRFALASSPGIAATILAALAPPLAAQSFQKNVLDIPQASTDTEQIDFADVDLDGDWDAAIANGGDTLIEQNELWINQGGASGGTLGVFLDETATRFPAVSDPSRDLEFADIDNDADQDLYVARHAQILNVGSRWWINMGGEQGGALGFFEDDTAPRWVGLGQPGSSISPGLLWDGSWIDWSGDADFADLDGDGDLDLVHSSYGGAYSGQVPTRLFLNDGDGRFAEFNPSGFQLAGMNIANGDPGLWCEGQHTHGTSNTTGLACDIADTVVDLEVADIDGDLDHDILWGPRSEGKPRFFRNRLDLGSLAFRDESGIAFPGLNLGGAVYEQELGDVDGDGDLDLYGLNWGTSGFAYPDLVLENVGGAFVNPVTLPGSTTDEEEGDFLDFDNDGDLDIYVANFSGQDHLYENLGGSPVNWDNVGGTELPGGLNAIGKDAEVADVDLDGDYDVFVANGTSPSANYYVENITGVIDTTAPWIPTVETIGPLTAGPGALRVRAHVYDNAPLYAVWYYDTTIHVLVDGVVLPALAMRATGGQVFWGEVPANLVGSISYRVSSTDGSGNTGTSGVQSYTATGDTGTSYGTETAATGASAPTIASLSEARAGSPLYLLANGQANAPCFLGVSLGSFGPASVPAVPNLTLNIDPAQTFLTLSGVFDGSGQLLFPLEVPAPTPAISVYVQLLDLAPDLTFGSSKGLRLDVQ